MNKDDILNNYNIREAERNNPNYRWHPRNMISVTYRHILERLLVSIFNRQNIDLKGGSILDIGCGYGEKLQFISSLFNDQVELHGIDLMPQRIESAKRLIGHRATLSIADASSIEYENGRFDLVSLFTILSSVSDQKMRDSIIFEAARSTKPSGYILIYDMSDNYFTRHSNLIGLKVDYLSNLFKGFELVHNSKVNNLLLPKVAFSWNLSSAIEFLPFPLKTNRILVYRKI